MGGRARSLTLGLEESRLGDLRAGVRVVRSTCEDMGVAALGVPAWEGVREWSIGGGSYAIVVSENFSCATSLAMLAPDRAPQ